MIGDAWARIAPMTRFYDIDAANAAVPELDGIVGVLAEQRAELVRLRDEVLAAGTSAGDGATTAVATIQPSGSRVVGETAADPPIVDDLRLTRLRMQGLIDQMAAGVARIDALGLTLRDIEHGLVDFPALVSGRQVWLCWQRGETCDRLLARPRDRVLRAAPAGRAGMTDRSVVVGRDGRAKAYRPLPDADRGRGPGGGPGRLRAGRLLRGARGPRARLDGDRRSRRARAPPGPDQGRRRLRPRCPRQPGRDRPEPRRRPGAAGRSSRGRAGRQHRAARYRCPRRGDRPPPGRSRRPSRWPDPRLHRACEGAPHEPARRSRPSTSPRPSAGCARIRTARSCSTSARSTSSRRSERRVPCSFRRRRS